MSDNLKVAKECGFHVYANTLGNTNNVDGTEHSLNTYTSRILALQQAAHDAEIAELRKEIAYAERCAVAQTEHAKTALEKLSAANAACAMKDEALKDIARGQLQVPDFEKYAVRVATDALSASPQQVAEWERKQLAEAEQRGAVKALEVFKEKYRCVFHKSGTYLGQAIAGLVDKEIATIEATSKKAG